MPRNIFLEYNNSRLIERAQSLAAANRNQKAKDDNLVKMAEEIRSINDQNVAADAVRGGAQPDYYSARRYLDSPTGSGSAILEYRLPPSDVQAGWVFGYTYINNATFDERGEIGFSFRVKKTVIIDHFGAADPVDPRPGAALLPFLPEPPNTTWGRRIVRLYEGDLSGTLLANSQAPTNLAQTTWKPYVRYWKAESKITLKPNKLYTLVLYAEKNIDYATIDFAAGQETQSGLNGKTQADRVISNIVSADWMIYEGPVGAEFPSVFIPPEDYYWLRWEGITSSVYTDLEGNTGARLAGAVLGGPSMAAGLVLPPSQKYLSTNSPITGANKTSWSNT